MINVIIMVYMMNKIKFVYVIQDIMEQHVITNIVNGMTIIMAFVQEKVQEYVMIQHFNVTVMKLQISFQLDQTVY